MRLTELLDVEVIDADGRSRGKVLDVRLAQRGPVVGTFGAAFVPESLLIGPRSIGARLGYERRDMLGPWPVRALALWLHADARIAAWSDLRSIQGHRIDIRSRGDDLPHPRDIGGDGPTAPSASSVDAGLDLLDHQVLDADGRMAGKCDDLRFAYPEGGGVPYVDAILAGPGALESRIGGRLGRWVASIHARVQDRDRRGPASIGFGVVKRLGSAIELSVPRDDLDVMRFEAWVRDRVISNIPGAG
jgi:hypothetical protein